MILTSWIGGFLLGLVFAVLCAWIDGWFYRRSLREEINHARLWDYVDTLDSHGIRMLEGHLRWLEQVREQVQEKEARQP